MNIANIDLSEINWMLFKHMPDKPAYYVQFDRNITVQEFANKIESRIPEDIRNRLDYYGPDAPFKSPKLASPINATDDSGNARHIYLTTSWEPGSNEGYFNHVYAVSTYGKPGRTTLWVAKTFDMKAAISLDICLHCWINGGPINGQGKTAKQILAHIIFDD